MSAERGLLFGFIGGGGIVGPVRLRRADVRGRRLVRRPGCRVAGGFFAHRGGRGGRFIGAFGLFGSFAGGFLALGDGRGGRVIGAFGLFGLFGLFGSLAGGFLALGGATMASMSA